MATLINIGNNIKVNPKFISYFEGLEIVLANKHRFTVSADVIELAKAYVENRNTGALHYKGTVATVANLPQTGQVTGDMYNVQADGQNYAWDGSRWDSIGALIDLDPLWAGINANTTAISEEVANRQADVSSLEAQISAKTSAEIAADFEAVKAKLNAVADRTETGGYWVFAFTDANGNVTFGQTITGDLINGI